MKSNYRCFVWVTVLLCSVVASAQNLNSAYFLDGYAHGHRLNPAKDYDRKGYVSIPLLGNVNYGMLGNLSLSDVFMDNDGELSSFLRPDIPVSEALAGFSADNYSRMDMNVDLLSLGFRAWGGFNTFHVSMRSNAGFDAPFEFFEAAKDLTNKDYNIDGVSLEATSWAEIALGHSRKVADAWRVGGKLKVLLGMGRAKLNVNYSHLDLTSIDRWIMATDVQAEVSVKGFTWGETETKEYSQGGTYEQINFNNIDVNDTGLNGWGLGFDLGAEWDLGEQGWLDGMTVSASLLDLGFISWDETLCAYNDGKEVIFNGFEDVYANMGTDIPVNVNADGYADRISDLIAMRDGGRKSVTSMLGATLNIGVEYQMPFYKKLSAGFLSTTRIQGAYSWNEERFSATVSPLKWLEASVNVGFGTMGTSFGWVANIHPKGFNLFVGMDRLVGGFSKHGLPTSGNTSMTVGMTIPFGKSGAN